MAKEEFNLSSVYANIPASNRAFAGVTRIKTGSDIFDLVLGGGIPLGSSIAIASEPGIGKSTLLLNTAKSFIKQGKRVLYLDYEKGVTPSLLDGMGLTDLLYDPESNPDGMFHIFWPSTFGEGEKIVDSLIPSGEFGLCVVDSASFMIPDDMVADREKDRVSITANRPGWQAQMMSRWSEKYLCFGNKYGTAFIYVQQMRTKISFVNTTVEASGGYAIKHAVSATILMKRDSYLTKSVETMDGSKNDVKFGADVRIWCSKSRISKPFVEGVVTIIFGKGVSNIYTYMKWVKGQKIEVEGKQKPILAMAGAGFYTLTLPSGEYKARGENQVYNLVKEHLAEIRSLVEQRGGLKLIVSGDGDE